MTDLATSANEPAYITKLGLRAAPFNQTIATDLFFAAGQAGHRLNLLLHLLRSSEKVVNVVADVGLGKSTLLHQLMQRAGDELRLCYIDAEQQTDVHIVLANCLVAFGVNSQDIESATDPIAVLMQRLSQLRQLKISPVLLIDNADVLSAELRDMLANWLSAQDESGGLLQAVLASSSPYQFYSVIDSRMQTVSLPVLPERELPAYLLFRLKRVGFQGDTPFSDKDLKRIYQHSKGVPAKINQLAHQQLLGIKPRSSFWAKAGTQLLQRWMGVVIIVVSILLLLAYQDTINGWFDEQDKSMQQENEPVHFEPEEPLPLVVTEEQEQRDELAELLAEIPTDLTPLNAPETSGNLPITPVDSQPVAPAEESTEVSNEPVLRHYHQKDWILEQADRDYTFQLMGSWDRQEVYDFMDKYQLVGDVAIFESTRNGKVWHVLLYGLFDSKQAALAASETWPEPLNSVPSWLRRFDSIHIQIKNKAVIESSPP